MGVMTVSENDAQRRIVYQLNIYIKGAHIKMSIGIHVHNLFTARQETKQQAVSSVEPCELHGSWLFISVRFGRDHDYFPMLQQLPTLSHLSRSFGLLRLERQPSRISSRIEINLSRRSAAFRQSPITLSARHEIADQIRFPLDEI